MPYVGNALACSVHVVQALYIVCGPWQKYSHVQWSSSMVMLPAMQPSSAPPASVSH